MRQKEGMSGGRAQGASNLSRGRGTVGTLLHPLCRLGYVRLPADLDRQLLLQPAHSGGQDTGAARRFPTDRADLFTRWPAWAGLPEGIPVR